MHDKPREVDVAIETFLHRLEPLAGASATLGSPPSKLAKRGAGPRVEAAR